MAKKRKTKPKFVREDTIESYRVRGTFSAAVMAGNVVSAADFKANCLSLMDEVREKGTEFIITKHNRPVARLVPLLETAESKFIGRGSGVLSVKGDIVAAIAPDWEEGADI